MHVSVKGKKMMILAAAISAFVIIFVAAHAGLYLSEDAGLARGRALFALSILGGAAIFPLLIIWPTVNEKAKLPVNVVLFFVMPLLSVQMVECMNGRLISTFTFQTGLANYMIYLVFYLALWLITGRFHLTGLIINILLYAWALANYTIELFRGTPFLPSDILSIRTGLNVADNYTFELSALLILGSILFGLIFLLNRHIPNIKPTRRSVKAVSKSLAGVYLAVVVLTFFFTDISANTGYTPDFWNQSRGYHKTGSFFNFCLNTKYLYAGKPAGYDAADVEDLLNDTLSDYGVDPDGDTSLTLLTGENDYEEFLVDGVHPNIIYIMNESWADLGHLGDLETNEDYMPFVHGLTENTIKGYLSVPVFGAGTSNSEFEALTGNTMQFLPAGSNAYQLYIKKATPSIVSEVTSLGYSDVGFHPYYGNGWKRDEVYPLLGFSDFISIEDIIDEDILDTYDQNGDAYEYEDLLIDRYGYAVGSRMLVRRFISDAYDYQLLMQMFEERDPDVPFFAFNVTMQNHGSYNYSYRNLKESITIESPEGDYPKAQRYLSLVKYTDNAFEDLVEYFSQVDEPTVICMFGDHLPSVENAFYEALFGSSLDELSAEQEELRYETPFVIWANYDIGETWVDRISANYLSVLVEQTAGLPMTQYDKFLAATYQTLPVIDSVGYIDAEGAYFAASGETPYDDLLSAYRCIQYNSLLDKKNRQDELFYLK